MESQQYSQNSVASGNNSADRFPLLVLLVAYPLCFTSLDLAEHVCDENFAAGVTPREWRGFSPLPFDHPFVDSPWSPNRVTLVKRDLS